MSLLKIDNLSVNYAGVTVLNDITAHLEAGELVALIGANASGKSTLVRVLAGLKTAERGFITFDDRITGDRPPIGLAVDPNVLPGSLSGFQAIELVAKALGTEFTDEAFAYATAVNMYHSLKRHIGTYSLGTRQKLAITLALVGSPRLVLLDESLNGLDLLSVGQSLEYFHERTQSFGQSTLLVTHNLDLVQHYADRVWMLDHGRLVREWERSELSEMRVAGQLLSRLVLDWYRRAALMES